MHDLMEVLSLPCLFASVERGNTSGLALGLISTKGLKGYLAQNHAACVVTACITAIWLLGPAQMPPLPGNLPWPSLPWTNGVAPYGAPAAPLTINAFEEMSLEFLQN